MALPKYMADGAKKLKKSQQQESRLAGIVGGKVQRGSGSKDFHKGDVKSQDLLIEAKRTDKDSMSVKKSWLVKIFRESMTYGKIPALSIEFDDMPDIVPKDWVAVPASTLRLLMEYYKIGIEEEIE